MQIIEKLIEEYGKSLSTNALVFQNNKKLKFLFFTAFWSWFIISITGTLLLLFQKLPEIYLAILWILSIVVFYLILQWIKNKAINRNFPKIKTGLFIINHPEITALIEKNTEKYIEENRLENKLAEVSSMLEQKLEVTKNQNVLLYVVIGSILITFLNSFLTALFEKLKDLSVSTFIGISIVILICLIIIGIGLVFLRKFLDDFSTEYDKIYRIKNYIDDYRLKK